MSYVQWVWLICLTLYLLFFGWYTPLGGALSEEEIEAYLQRFEERDPAPSEAAVDRLRRFMQEDTGGAFVMINLIDLYEQPLQMEAVDPQASSEEVLDKYMDYMYPALFSRASHPVLYGRAAGPTLDLMNAEGMENWTFSAGMRYRSRRDLLEIVTNPAFAGSHEFKVAAMRKTIAVPADPWFHSGDPRLLAGLMLLLVASLLSWRSAANKARR